MKDKPSALPFRGGLIMLPKGNIQQNGYFTYRVLCAVIHVVWIAAFLSFGRIYNSFISYTFLRAHSSMGAYFIYKRLLQQGLSALPLPTL